MIEVTRTDHDFSAVEERMQWYIDEELIPFCSMAVLHGTDVVHVAHVGGGTPETTPSSDSILRMYSNTKLVTSVLAMMLFEEGRFALDDPLALHLPEFGDMQVLRPEADNIDDVVSATEPIRVAHILSHSAGLSYGFIEPESTIDRAYGAAGLNPLAGAGFTLEELCQGLGTLPLVYEPGSSWRYSFATDVVARLIEVLSGKRFDEFMADRLLEPLGMVDTDFWVPESKRDRQATMYLPADPMDAMTRGLSPLPSDALDGPPPFLSGGGGLYSTLSDYLRFLQMVINGGEWNGHRYLESSTLDLMRTNQLAPGVGLQFPAWRLPDTTFGLGFALKEAPAPGEPDTAVGEYHWGGMAGTHSWMAPQANLTGVCFTQRMPGFWHPFSHDFKRLVYEATA